MDNILLICSLVFNVLLGLRPVLTWLVKKTKTTKDDELLEHVYKLIDEMSEQTRERLLNRINH